MPRAAGTLLGNKDLLVPLALLTIAGKLLGWLAAAPIHDCDSTLRRAGLRWSARIARLDRTHQ